ncbi:hypothetical protein ACVXHB_03190 [Escherichia coli]
MQLRSEGAGREAEDIPLPRSLTRYARSFGCGERTENIHKGIWR